MAILIFSRVAFWVNPSSDDDRKLVRTKPRRFGDVCGGARSRREKKSTQVSPGCCWREKNLIFWPENFSLHTEPTRLHITRQTLSWQSKCRGLVRTFQLLKLIRNLWLEFVAPFALPLKRLIMSQFCLACVVNEREPSNKRRKMAALEEFWSWIAAHPL